MRNLQKALSPYQAKIYEQKNRQTWAAKVNKIGIKPTSRVNKFAANDVAMVFGADLGAVIS